MSSKYDILVNYPALDTEIDNNSKLWINNFCKYLQLVINKQSDKDIRVITKDEILISKEFKDKDFNLILKNSSILISLLSADFINLNLYRLELENMCQLINEMKEPPRLININLSPVHVESLPDCVEMGFLYNFYEINPFNRKHKTYELHEENPGDIFWSKLIDLSYDVIHTFDSLKSEQKQPVKNNNKYIYLAETTFDQDFNRDEIRRELQQSGYNIIPVSPQPKEANALKIYMEELLQKCVLTIHMMGGRYGEYLKNAQYSLIDYQNQVVKEFMEKNPENDIQRLIWIPYDLKTTDQRQVLYLKRLKRDETQFHTEIIEAPIEALKTVLNTKLTEIEMPVKKVEAEKNSVYLIYEKNEQDKVAPIIQWAKNNKIKLHELDYQSHTIYSDHRKFLIDSESVIIYQGESNKFWLNIKLRDLVKVPGYGKKSNFKSVAIISDSLTENDIDIKINSNIKIIKPGNNFTEVM